MSGLTVIGGFDLVQGAGIQNAGTLTLTPVRREREPGRYHDY